MNLIDRLDRLAKDAAHGAFWTDEEFHELEQAINAVRADRIQTKDNARAAWRALGEAIACLPPTNPALPQVKAAMNLVRSLK